MQSFTVKDKVQINASQQRVWEVLTNPYFIKAWDDVPETYKGGNLELGSVLEWEGHARLTVTEYKEQSLLQLNMFLPKVELEPGRYNVNYRYKLTGNNKATELEVEVGDFAPLPNPQEYYNATLDFVSHAKQKIKELAENQ